MRAALLLTLLVACGKGDDPLEGDRSSCDPLDTSLCALPYPSSFYLADDPSTPTGKRVSYASDSMPINRDFDELDPTLWNEKDGFSTSGPLLTYFADVSLDGVVGHQDLGAYLEADARTVIVDAETGERFPHFVELDMTAEDMAESLLMLRNVAPFEHGRRYVVGIRGLKTNAGADVAVSEAFAALRDGEETEDYDVEFQRQHFEDDVFPVLEAAGFARGELQLAWDFTTVSRDNSLGRVLWMRDDMLERVGPNGPPYVVENIEEGDCAAGDVIARSLDVVMTVPLYTVEDAAGTMLTRDEAGWPFYNGDTEVDVRVRIPCSVATDPKPSFMVQYGHGLLGDRTEVNTGWMSDFLQEQRYVAFATDWTGMADEDVGMISVMLASDLSGFGMLPERSMQGLVQGVAALELMRGDLASDPAVTFDGVSVLDPERFGYYGNSQGGIMGGALVGLSNRLDKGVLGVPGSPYSLLLSRSADFDPFFLIFKNKYWDHREITLMIAAIQHLWDPAEAAGYLHTMDDPLPGSPVKQLLLQVAIGDAQVTPLGAEFMARAYGAMTVAPETRPIWGVEEAQPGFSGSAIVEWEYTDVPEAPVENLPPDTEHDPHECPRRELSGQAQIRDFFEGGTVEQHCDGPCVGLREDVCG